MEHCCNNHNSEKSIQKVFLINLCFAFLELIGGLISGSITLLADAVHDFGDSLAVGVSWWLERKSSEKPTPDYTFGKQRFSLLGGLVSAMVLVFGSIAILWHTASSFGSTHVVNEQIMFGFAMLGIAVNGWAYWQAKKGATPNEQVLSSHMLEDVLGWVAVFIGSLLISFTGWDWIDSVLAAGIAVYILWHGIGHLKIIAPLFLQATPSGLNISLIQEELKLIDGVLNVHDLHFWTLDGSTHCASLHVKHKTSKLEKLKQEIRNVLKKYQITHTTIEFETENESCDHSCL